jgi:uncharacterized membrane protein
MKHAKILSFVAIFVVVLALTAVVPVAAQFVNVTGVTVDGVENAGSKVVAGQVSEKVPVLVEFVANEDAEDVEVRIEIDGLPGPDVSERVDLGHVLAGRTYVARFTLPLPEASDIRDLTEDLSLDVEISAHAQDDVRESYDLTLQRELYSLEVLSVEVDERVLAGDRLALEVVVENNGHERLDNVYVKASIPELGVSRTVYVEDLDSVDEEDHDSLDTSRSRRLYLTVPRAALPGIYTLEVKAYTHDSDYASTTVERQVVVDGAETGVVPTTTARTVEVGEETTFNVVLLNPHGRMVVYSLTPEQTSGLIVDVAEPVVAVPADSSVTVKVRVKATESVAEGTHLVTVHATSESGLEKQVNLTLHVEDAKTATNTVAILTVVLAIIFVVLLVILIVLLTKRPVEAEEFGETNYY